MGKQSANKPKKGYSIGTDLDDICRTIEHLHINLRVKILSDGTDKAFYDAEIDKLKEVQNKINDYMKEVIKSVNSEKARANANSVLWCTLCNISFSQKRPKEHTLRKNTWQSTNAPTEAATLKFANKVNYELHVKFHDKKKSNLSKLHQCNPCNKTFMHSSPLVIHESTHSDEQPFTCDKCPQKFKLNSELKRHKKYCGLPKDKNCSVEEDCTYMYCDPRL